MRVPFNFSGFRFKHDRRAGLGSNVDLGAKPAEDNNQGVDDNHSTIVLSDSHTANVPN